MDRPQSHNKLNIPKASSEVEAASKGLNRLRQTRYNQLNTSQRRYSDLRNNPSANHVRVRAFKKISCYNPVIDVLYSHNLSLIYHVAHELAKPSLLHHEDFNPTNGGTIKS